MSAIFFQRYLESELAKAVFKQKLPTREGLGSIGLNQLSRLSPRRDYKNSRRFSPLPGAKREALFSSSPVSVCHLMRHSAFDAVSARCFRDVDLRTLVQAVSRYFVARNTPTLGGAIRAKVSFFMTPR